MENFVRSTSMKTVLSSDASKILRTSVKALAKTNPTFFSATGARWYAWQRSQGKKKQSGSFGRSAAGRQNADRQSANQSRPKNATFENMKTL